MPGGTVRHHRVPTGARGDVGLTEMREEHRCVADYMHWHTRRGFQRQTSAGISRAMLGLRVCPGCERDVPVDAECPNCGVTFAAAGR